MKKSIDVYEIIENENVRQALNEALNRQGFFCNQVHLQFKSRSMKLLIEIGVEEVTTKEVAE